MTAVTYNAVDRGSLVAGHTAGLSYSLDLRCLEGSPVRTRKVGEESQRTLNDTVETLRYYGKSTWQVQVLLLSSAELLAMREFLDSVEGGETFTFDEFGSVAVPVASVNVKRIAKGYQEAQIAGAANVYTISFDLEAA